jgi:hypothetical protein
LERKEHKMPQSEAVSLMEQKARRFPLTSRGVFSLLEKQDKEETLRELESLKPILNNLSQELREARSLVREKEKQFSLLANYKNLLERTIVLPRLVTNVKKKQSKESKLLEKLESLTPAQLEKLGEIKL